MENLNPDLYLSRNNKLILIFKKIYLTLYFKLLVNLAL